MKNRKFFWVLIPLSFTLWSCSTTPEKKVDEELLPEEFSLLEKPLPGLSQEESEVVVDEILDENQELAQNEPGSIIAEETPPTAQMPAPKQRLKRKAEIPIELNRRVGKWIHYFTMRDRERFQRFMDRGEKYRPLVEEILDRHSIPREIYFLAMIESGFSTHAASHASAVGVWQFIASTGRSYGLRSNEFVDERRDPIRATEAAAQYLKDLYEEFDSWHLAMAAYNSGENRVERAIKTGRTRDYWELVRRNLLPPETRDYVPKFLAAYIIGQNPTKFGFKISEVETYPEVKGVEVPSPIRVNDLAKVAQMSLEELLEVNPHFRRDFTPPHDKNYLVWIPVQKAKGLEKLQASLHKLKIRNVASLMPARTSRERKIASYHVVKSGDSLSSISDQYGMTIKQLSRLNRLRSKTIIKGQRLLVAKSLSNRGLANVIQGYRRDSLKSVQSKSRLSGYRSYRVKNGDHLTRISRKFGVSLADLKRVNRISGDRVVVGDLIKIPRS